jgi:hypothetical protein
VFLGTGVLKAPIRLFISSIIETSVRPGDISVPIGRIGGRLAMISVSWSKLMVDEFILDEELLEPVSNTSVDAI